MRRFIFNAAAILSLLVCLFFIYACLRSFGPSQMHFESIQGSLTILSWEGEVPSDSDHFNPHSETFYGTRTILRRLSRDSEWHFLGFHSIHGRIFRGVTYHIFAIPYWVLIPLTAILPIIWFRHLRRQRMRATAGHCLSCGYDLRESKDKCPECGATIPWNKGVTAI